MKITELNKDQYSSILDTDQNSFFSSTFWHNLFSEYSGLKYRILQIEENEGLYYLPVYQRKIRIIHTIHNNGPFGTYGGLISKNRYDSILEQSLLKELSKKLNLDYVGSPFYYKEDLVNSELFTQTADLTNLELSNFSKNHQRSIQKACNQHVQICFTENFSKWEEYFQLYLQQTRQRGSNATNKYEEKLLPLIYKLPTCKRKLWIAEHNKKIISGAIIFYKNNATYWHGANSNIAKKYGSSHLLHFEIMKNAKSEGFNIYDFSPSGGHSGVINFKKGFGTKYSYFRVVEIRTNRFKSDQKMFHKIKGILS